MFFEYLKKHCQGMSDCIQFEVYSPDKIAANRFSETSYPVAVFGAGGRGEDFLALWESHGGSVKHFVDNNSALWGQETHGIPICSPEDLNDKRMPVVVASLYWRMICQQLQTLGFRNIKIFLPDHTIGAQHDFLKDHKAELDQVMSLLKDDASRQWYTALFHCILDDYSDNLSAEFMGTQYHHPSVHAEDGDIILNCGAYMGTTDFLYHAVAKDCTVHSFEPYPPLFAQLVTIAKEIKTGQTIPVKYGLWNKKGKVSFSNDGCPHVIDSDEGSGSQISQSIDVTTIDEYCAEKGIAPDMIKMDLEGAEPFALEGARKTISTHRPKLQISIYHTVDQRISIPLQIDEMVSDYEYYVGHHSFTLSETILYGIPRR